jgi:hypothetical protein
MANKSTGIGVGLIAKDFANDGQTTYTNMTNLGTKQLVYNGELEGVTKAIEYIHLTFFAIFEFQL